MHIKHLGHSTHIYFIIRKYVLLLKCYGRGVFFYLRKLISYSFWYILGGSVPKVKVHKLTVSNGKKQVGRIQWIYSHRIPTNSIIRPYVFCTSCLLFILLAIVHWSWKALGKQLLIRKKRSGVSNPRAIDFEILPLIESCLEMQVLLYRV